MNDSTQELQSHLFSLKQQHQVQQQLLLQQYHESQLRLAQEQEKQMSEHVKVNVCVEQPVGYKQVLCLSNCLFLNGWKDCQTSP